MRASNCSACRFAIFFQLHFNKLYPTKPNRDCGNYVRDQGLPKTRLYKEYVRRKVNNAPGVDLRRNFAFASTFFFPQRNNVTWAQSVNRQLVSGQLKKNKTLSPRYKVTQYWSADSLMWQLSINNSVDVQKYGLPPDSSLENNVPHSDASCMSLPMSDKITCF